MFKGLKTIAALVAGATIGMLFSPKKGEDIRNDLKKEVEQGGSGFSTIKENATAFGKDISDTAKDGYEEVQKNKKVKDTVKKVKKVKKKVEKTVKNIKKK